MSKERDQRPQPLTFEQVCQRAIESALEHGQHAPTYIVEGTRSTTVVQLDATVDSDAKLAFQAMGAGVYVAQAQDLGNLRQVFFIMEAWMRSYSETDSPKQPPSDDPDRKEILLISRWQSGKQDNRVAAFDLVRDTDGQLIRLEQWGSERKLTAEKITLLDAFVEGFQIARSGRNN